MKRNLSKSQFIRDLQCHKSLWLYKYNPDLRPKPSEAMQSVFDSGTEVGELARGLFPDGELIKYEGSSIDEKLARTKDLIEGCVKTIYEATFRFEKAVIGELAKRFPAYKEKLLNINDNMIAP